MKQINNYFLFLIIFTFLSCNQSSKFEKKQKVKIIENIIDIGVNKKDSLSEAIFKIVNISDNELFITHAVSSCHCTTSELASKKIQSGDTLEIKVDYDNNKLGFFEQTVSVYFQNIKESPLLIMRGKITE